ncbi:hypothetical protein [Streptosporangium carneum]|uniref:Uncharacterized protein n=1 Tax=Streptosporangium carneum TaxID=47481 RepID=A0A9W6IBU0_9ACTN|nr:hypothetical protein [Streptosporangium carneum]GLK14813.1 hypothetical protein GCM10017600_82250 [Streptosporangium carneum]
MPDSRELHDLLRTVRSGDVESATDALFHLKNRICPQGVAVSGETATALPALIDVIVSGRSIVRGEVLRLVARISRASHAWRNSARHARPEYAGNYVGRIEWEVAVDRAFRDAVPVLVRLESDAEPEVASIAHDLAERYRRD